MLRKVKNFLHKIEAAAANLYFGYPSRKMFILGVTGTDGKTTTASLIYHILRENNKKVALISSVGAYIGNKIYDVGFHVTTPASFPLQKYIRKALNVGTGHLVLEVTSHALDQARVFGINFDIGVITNVSHEHLDYHKTYEKYLNVKSELLKKSKIAVLNRDEPAYELLRKLCLSYSGGPLRVKKIITYGLDRKSDINPYNFKFTTKLVGEFNKYNILAAAAACRQIGLTSLDISKAIKSFNAPIGRQEVVYDGAFKVMIDFAHTPNAFQKILPEIKKLTGGRLIHVFGSAGQRDKSKRPQMGKTSAEFSDIIVLTAEDPRNESVDKIVEEITAGIDDLAFEMRNSNQAHYPAFKIEKGKKYIFKVPDRKKAIEFAVSIARRKDTVLLTGKGHEKSMNYGAGEKAWDEFAIVRSALQKNHR